MTDTTTVEPLSGLPNDIGDQARAILERACKGDVSIVTAESCTGGLLASLLTDIEGASHAFERGFVVYTEEAKSELLDIDAALIDRCTAVSREVAEAMAQGALARSHGDVAMAITGYAGPGAPGDEPGLVHFGCALRDGPTWHREEHFGDIGRGPVREKALRVALEMLDEAVG
jgi:nicotinamide-nucleotide amidase